MMSRCSVLDTKIVPASITQHSHWLDLHACPEAAVVRRPIAHRGLIAAASIHVARHGNIWIFAIALGYDSIAQGACQGRRVLMSLALVLGIGNVGRAVDATALATLRGKQVLLCAAPHHAHFPLMLTNLHVSNTM